MGKTERGSRSQLRTVITHQGSAGACARKMFPLTTALAALTTLGCFQISDPPPAQPARNQIPTDPVPMTTRTSSSGTGQGGRARNKWSKDALTYKLVGSVDIHTLGLLRTLYQDAAQTITEVVPIELREAHGEEEPDIEVELCSVCSSPPCCDELRIDGVDYWGWAELPTGDRSTTQIVQVFDELGSASVANLQYALILHEIGHSLGLVHSADNHAVMYEYIDRESRSAVRAVLSEDDISQLQELYGSRDRTISPVVPNLPLTPDGTIDPVAEGPDEDRDGLADTFEESVSGTDPRRRDTDMDGLGDGFEVEFGLDATSADSDGDGERDGDELAAGTPARAPLICDAAGEPPGLREIWVAKSLFNDLGLAEGEEVTITNLRNDCLADRVVVHRDADSSCTLKIPLSLRNLLCVFQLNTAVPMRIFHDDEVTPPPPIVSTSRKLVWTDNGSDVIRRANLDGTSVEELPISGLLSPQGIVVDSIGGKLYWTDWIADKIQRANLDGTSVESLPIGGLNSPQGIALDSTGGKIYWTDNGSDVIRRANLDGTSVEELPISGLLSPQGIVVDPIGRKLYWTDWIADKIQRANLDGTSVESLPIGGLNSPQDIALDSFGGKIYWTDNGSDVIRRANVDGTSVEELPISGLLSPQGIVVDSIGGKLYWTDWIADKIQRANLDGTSVESLPIGGLNSPQSIAIVKVPISGLERLFPDTDADGVLDSADRCPNSPSTERPVDAEGCSVSQRDHDNDGVEDNKDQCPGTLVAERSQVDDVGCGPSQATQIPVSPSDLEELFVDAHSAILRWQDNSSGENGFIIEQSTDGVVFREASRSGTGGIGFSIVNLQPGTHYYFRIRAFNEAGISEPSNILDVATIGIPSPPSNLMALFVDAHSATLGWQDNSSSEVGFIIELSSDALVFGESSRTGPGGSGFTITNLQPGTHYFFRVRAFNDAGISTPSNIVDVATTTVPSSPSNLMALFVDATSARFGWQDNADSEDGYIVELSTDGAVFGESSRTGANVVGFSVANLQPASHYYFRVRAFNAAGVSAPSNVLDVLTSDPCSPPAAPSACIATRQGNTSAPDPIRVTWNYSGIQVSGFRVARLDPGKNPDSFADWDNVGGDLTPATRMFVDSSQTLVNGQTFRYKVRAFIDGPCGRVFGDYSNSDPANP